MGLPADDYLAGVPGVSRIGALRLAGNGVVPRHAEVAFRELARRAVLETASGAAVGADYSQQGRGA